MRTVPTDTDADSQAPPPAQPARRPACAPACAPAPPPRRPIPIPSQAKEALMLFILTQIVKYLFIFIVYWFILKIATLIYRDIKSITHGEDAKALIPHIKLMATVGGKPTDTVLELYPLAKARMTIGRKTQNNIILKDNHVSSQHGCISMEADSGHFFIEDLGSANGTWLNGQRLTPKSPQRLHPGDVILMGSTRMVFSEGGH